MNKFTNSNFTHKNNEQTNNLPEKLREDDVVRVKKILNTLSENCEKVSEKSIKTVVDFAKSYKVLKSKEQHSFEVNLN